MKKILSLFLVVGIFAASAFVPITVNAQTLGLSANLTVDGSSNVLVNGQQAFQNYVANGDTVNVAFSNNTGSNVIVCLKGSSGQSIASGGSATVPVTVNGSAELDINLSSGSCLNGGGNPGYVYIAGAAGSLSCSLSSKVWTVTGHYSGVPMTTNLYRGSTYVAAVAAGSGGGQTFNNNVNVQFAAQTTAATYYLRDGTNASAEVIGQATCPAIPAATRSTPAASTPSSSTSSTPPGSTPAPANTTPAPSAEKTGDSNPPAKVSTKDVAVKSAHKDTALIVTSGAVLALLSLIVVLSMTHLIVWPKQLLSRLAHKKA